MGADEYCPWCGSPLWFCRSELMRTLILVYESSNSQQYINYSKLIQRVDDLPDVAKEELAATLRRLAKDVEEGRTR